jgi:MEMO1 family protein
MATQDVPLASAAGDVEALRGRLASANKGDAIAGEILAIIVPDAGLEDHATLVESVYENLSGRDYETVIIVSASHEGYFRRMTIPGGERYRDCSIDDAVRNELCDEDDDIFVDETGHHTSDGASSQIPYLRATLGEFKVVPVVMGDESPEFINELATALGEIMFNRTALIVATADVLGGRDDTIRILVGALEEKDPDGLLKEVVREETSVSGSGAIVAAMRAALQRRATDVHVVASASPTKESSGAIGAIIYRRT